MYLIPNLHNILAFEFQSNDPSIYINQKHYTSNYKIISVLLMEFLCNRNIFLSPNHKTVSSQSIPKKIFPTQNINNQLILAIGIYTFFPCEIFFLKWHPTLWEFSLYAKSSPFIFSDALCQSQLSIYL